jgi:hypothetical protein
MSHTIDCLFPGCRLWIEAVLRVVTFQHLRECIEIGIPLLIEGRLTPQHQRTDNHKKSDTESDSQKKQEATFAGKGDRDLHAALRM